MTHLLGLLARAQTAGEPWYEHEECIDARTFARRLNMTLDGAYRALKKGKLPVRAVQLRNRFWRISKADTDRLLEEVEQ